MMASGVGEAEMASQGSVDSGPNYRYRQQQQLTLLTDSATASIEGGGDPGTAGPDYVLLDSSSARADEAQSKSLEAQSRYGSIVTNTM